VEEHEPFIGSASAAISPPSSPRGRGLRQSGDLTRDKRRLRWFREEGLVARKARARGTVAVIASTSAR